MDSTNPRFKRLWNQYVLVFVLLIPILLISPNIFSQVMEEWVVRYNGSGNDNDSATAIAIDTTGNVYVTGQSIGSGTAEDYATIKYNNAGIQQWVTRYNGPGNDTDSSYAIAIDISGNVYVTGYSSGSGTSYDYATIKYNIEGIQQWVERYNGPGNKDDKAVDIVVDSSGNVYVTGESYDSGTDFDYATIMYNNAGIEQWVTRYNGPGNGYDGAHAIAIDTSGNVYVTGESYGSGTHLYYDYATIKYNNAGIQQWVARYDSPGNNYDAAKAIAIDSSGNVFVTGHSVGSGTNEDYATIMYNSSGEEQWVARYNGPGNRNDYATAIALDSLENVYVTGGSNGSGTYPDYYDYATIKYNNAGIEQWVTRYYGPVNYYNIAYAIALDDSGNVYVTGVSFGGLGTSYDYATIKYNNTGVEQWVARYDGSGNPYDYDYACAIALDISGNVYVTGISRGSETAYDYATIKYSQNVAINQEIWMNY